MKTMQFMPQLKAYLKEHGLIYTVRKYSMSYAEVDIDGMLCKRIPLGKIESKEDLEPYAKESGLDTVEAWWKKIKEINPGVKDLWLYKVERIQGGELYV